MAKKESTQMQMNEGWCDAVLKVHICSSTFLFLEGLAEKDG